MLGYQILYTSGFCIKPSNIRNFICMVQQCFFSSIYHLHRYIHLNIIMFYNTAVYILDKTKYGFCLPDGLGQYYYDGLVQYYAFLISKTQYCIFHYLFIFPILFNFCSWYKLMLISVCCKLHNRRCCYAVFFFNILNSFISRTSERISIKL